MTTNEQNETDARHLKDLRVRVADGYALASGEDAQRAAVLMLDDLKWLMDREGESVRLETPIE